MIMFDNVQENDMEGILSSIKDILEEDANKQQANTDLQIFAEEVVEDNTVDSVVEDSIPTEVDDVLELSPDMRVDDVQTDNDDLNVDLDIDELVQSSEDINDFINEIPSNKPFFDTNDTSETIASNEPFFDINNQDLALDDLLDDSSKEEPFSEMPVFEEATTVDELIAEMPVFEEAQAVDEPIVEDPVFEEAPIVNELTADEPVVTIEQAQEDPSTSIMNNFAKMFSHEEKQEAATISHVGDSSKTLEDFVVDAIGKVIGKEVSEKWNNGSAFNDFAEAEIRRLFSAWIDENMPSMVEAVVKKEFERVISKFGS